jgi:hypothetical protein
MWKKAFTAREAGQPRPTFDPLTPSGLRVVVHRRSSVRLECRRCGLRFSVDPGQLADVLGDGQPEDLRALDSWNKHLRPRKRFRHTTPGGAEHHR